MKPRYLRPRDRGNYKESAVYPITKASNSSHCHIPLILLFSTFPAMQYQRFFSLFDTFSHLTNSKKKKKKNALSVEFLYHKDSNMFPPPNKVKLDTVTIEEMKLMLSPFGRSVPSLKINLISCCLRLMLLPEHCFKPQTMMPSRDWEAELKCSATGNPCDRFRTVTPPPSPAGFPNVSREVQE